MPRTNFYDPQVGESESMQIRGLQVTIGGTYVLMDDVITALRAYAQSLEPDDAAAVHGAGNWLQEGAQALPQVKAEVEEVPYEVYGAESDDITPDVARVEIYPDPPEDPRPKWYARSIDTGGHILKVTNGSFDQAWVIQNAQERWPGTEIHLLRSAGEDSMWTENQPAGGALGQSSTRGTFPSLGPPVRRLWAGAGR